MQLNSTRLFRFEFFIFIVTLFGAFNIMAAEEIFNRTPEGEIQVRTLPAARWITTETDGSYFDNSGNLFGRLFNFIRMNNISMTVPVEGDLSRAQMRFYISKEVDKVYADTDNVRVVDVPERTVVSLSARGSYSENNVIAARKKLEDWLRQQTDWQADGPAYVVFWNGPMTLWFLKHFEIHIPLQPVNLHSS